MAIRRLFLALALALLPCLLHRAETLRAQVAGPEESPEAAAGSFFDALESYRWSEAAAHFDEDSLAVWRGRVVGALATVPALPPRPEAADADSAPSMAEFLEFLMSRRIAMVFAGVETLEELEDLDDREAAARALEAASPEGQLHAAVEMIEAMAPEETAGAETDPRVAAELAGQMSPSAERVVVGSLAGPRPDVAYVVYRLLWGNVGEDVAVLPMVRSGDDWRVAPRGEILLRELPPATK